MITVVIIGVESQTMFDQRPSALLLKLCAQDAIAAPTHRYFCAEVRFSIFVEIFAEMFLRILQKPMIDKTHRHYQIVVR